MRSFLAAVALLLAAIIGTVSLTAYVAHETVLDPHSSGRLVASAMQDSALRHRILAEAVPGYDNLPSEARDGVDQVAENPQFHAAVRKVQVDADGTVHLSRLRQAIEARLRAGGQAQLADQLAAVGGPDTVRLPSRVSDQLAGARDTSWTMATRGAVAALAMLLAGVLVARNRRGALQGAGWAVLVACGLTGLLWFAAPTLAQAAGYSAWSDAVKVARQSYASQVISTLAPVAMAGLALVVVSFLVPSHRRAR